MNVVFGIEARTRCDAKAQAGIGLAQKSCTRQKARGKNPKFHTVNVARIVPQTQMLSRGV